MKTKFILSIAILFCMLFASVLYAQAERSTLFTNGRFLYTPCGELVTLRGINKMVVWTYDLKLRHDSYAEIRKTGANSVRIVWLANPSNQENDAGPSGLDKNIQDCIDSKMIPMVELHDATGDWSGLQTCVNYWTSPEVLAVVKKHERYLLINIANECGNETVTDNQFIAGYTSAIQQIRNAGIKAPLVIDATDWGKNFEQLRNTGATLINQDPEHNLIFSVHMYWAISEGADATFITQQVQAAVDVGLPFIVGEFTYLFNRDIVCEYETDYKTIIKICQEREIGWMPWEWGPGNDYNDKSCGIMNMTEDGYFNTLKDTWAKEVAITSQYSIAQTSVTSKYIDNGGKCDVDEVENELAFSGEQNFFSYPNPFGGSAIITINLKESSGISLKLYNSLGAHLSTIAEGHFEKGKHQFNLSLNPTDADGIYYCILSGTDYRNALKLIKMKH